MLQFKALAESGNTGSRTKATTVSTSQLGTIRQNASAMRGKGTKSTIKQSSARASQGKATVYRGRTSTNRTRG